MTTSSEHDAASNCKGLSISVEYQQHCYRLKMDLLGQEFWYCDDELIALKRLNWRCGSTVEHKGLCLQMESTSFRHGRFTLRVLDQGEVVAERHFEVDVEEQEPDKNDRPAWPVRCSPVLVLALGGSVVMIPDHDPVLLAIALAGLALVGMCFLRILVRRGITVWPFAFLGGYLAGTSAAIWQNSGEIGWLFLAAVAIAYTVLVAAISLVPGLKTRMRPLTSP